MKEKPYNREKAVEYAKKWAFSRNPRYFDFENFGGDCTNFISQCVYAGTGVMNYTRIYGWYYNSSYDRAPAWTGVQFFYNFMVKNKSVGPFATEVDLSYAELGDIIQLGDWNRYYHSMIITQINGLPSLDTILISTHSEDANLRPLNTYTFERIRCLHIEGYRVF
jgi:hypothetical protein